MPADDPDFWAKGERFRRYAKACRLAHYHQHGGKYKGTGPNPFIDLNKRIARELAAHDPEFPDTFRTYFPKEADKAID